MLRKILFNLPMPGAAKPEVKKEEAVDAGAVGGGRLQILPGGGLIRGNVIIHGGGVLQLNGGQVIEQEIFIDE